MPDYVRPRVAGARGEARSAAGGGTSGGRSEDRTGGAPGFTVALAARGSRVLVDEVGRLREAVRMTRAERPFEIDAWVVLPDHLHCVWTLPAGDADYSVRWGAIKARFSMSCRRAGFTPPAPVGRENGGVNPPYGARVKWVCGSPGSGSTTSDMRGNKFSLLRTSHHAI